MKKVSIKCLFFGIYLLFSCEVYSDISYVSRLINSESIFDSETSYYGSVKVYLKSCADIDLTLVEQFVISPLIRLDRVCSLVVTTKKGKTDLTPFLPKLGYLITSYVAIETTPVDPETNLNAIVLTMLSLRLENKKEDKIKFSCRSFKLVRFRIIDDKLVQIDVHIPSLEDNSYIVQEIDLSLDKKENFDGQ